ncbi:MAG TPA: sigma-54 dependent transcriptional regulator [Candidatus Acidoferrum sp.]|nr:sigma-54 dependent transcriptional regulator [Candidatus Acidoferrum sp.]
MEKILVVDDDLSLCHFLTKALAQRGYQTLACHTGGEALGAIRGQEMDLVLLDNKLPDRNGLEILREVKQDRPKVPVIIMTAFGTTETAIEAMRLGAFDYILKPFELDEVLDLVGKGLEAHKLMSRAVAIPALSEYREDSDPIIGKSRVMQEVYKLIGQIAESDVTVLIRGESGTGKELVARAIYHHSRRKNGPFLAINCAAIPETLLESELFGHEKGAFTGANKRRIGKFEQCDRGTILLDEIGDMSLTTQAKILRVLQEGEFERIGGNETIRVDVRVLTSTNRKLEELIKQGKFRGDLYYRLKIMSVTLPPLRERKEDIRELTEYFFRVHKEQSGGKISYIHPGVFEKLAAFGWPGNVRELANTIKRSLILCKGNVLTAEDVAFDVEREEGSFASEEEFESTLVKVLDPLFADIQQFRGSGLHPNVLEKVEKYLVQKALAETKGNQVHAAKLLGISRNTLRNRIEKYNLSS